MAKEGMNGTLCAEEKIIEKVLNLLRKFIGINKFNIKVSYSKTKIFKTIQNVTTTTKYKIGASNAVSLI